MTGMLLPNRFRFEKGVAVPNCIWCRHYEEDPSVGHVGCAECMEELDCVREGVHDFITDREFVQSQLDECYSYIAEYSDFVIDDYNYDPESASMYTDYCRMTMEKIAKYEKWLAENP